MTSAPANTGEVVSSGSGFGVSTGGAARSLRRDDEGGLI